MTDLKPCPFCGCAGEDVSFTNRWGADDSFLGSSLKCECGIEVIGPNGDAVRRFWNNRPSEEALCKRIEATQKEPRP